MITITKGGQVVPLSTGQALTDEILASGPKIIEMMQAGWNPHPAQLYFHISLDRYRVASAGRRGGKTEAAAYEFAILCHPRHQMEALKRYGVKVEKLKPNEPIIGCIVIPKKKGNTATLRKFLYALESAGIARNAASYGYRYNKNEDAVYIYGADPDNPKTIIYLRAVLGQDTASMRGEGYSLAWWDEPGSITNSGYWEAFEPSLDDFRGICIFTTSPGEEDEAWWFYDLFLDKESQEPDIASFEWYSADNPVVSEEALKRKTRALARGGGAMIIYQREYEARWDKNAGGDLKLNWLRGYDKEDKEYNFHDHRRYEHYIGVDPAIGQKDASDATAMCVIAKDRQTSQGYVVDWVNERLDIQQQIDKIVELNKIWKPLLIHIEPVGYQRALAQLVANMPGKPPAEQAQYPQGSKRTRLMGLGPVAHAARVLFDKEHPDFDEFQKQWVELPNSKHDDMLDALDIAIRSANIYDEFDEIEMGEEDQAEQPARTMAWLRQAQEAYGSDEHSQDEVLDSLGDFW